LVIKIMIVTTRLSYNSGFRWQKNKELAVKGYIIDKEKGCINNDKLGEYFSDRLNNCNDYIELLRSINGSFSLIYTFNNTTLIYSDKTRFFPLFYKYSGNEIIISDNPELLLEKTDTIDINSTNEFRLTGYTTGNKTLFKNIYQVQAAELLILKNNKITSESTFSFKVAQEEKIQYADPKKELFNTIERAFTPLLKSLEDKTPVLPLSGGFDSRLIACKLKDLGFNNTICFTYGRPNKEVDLSQKVAERLNFKWYFIDYEKLMTGRNLLLENEFLQYYRYASRGTSMFYLQEFPAVEYLKNNKFLPENSVFLPGHSGDLLGGSQFVKSFSPSITTSKVPEQIVKTKYFLFPMSSKECNKFIDDIKTQIGPAHNFSGYSVFEDWDIKEKIAKFIFNSSQVFTYFGYETRFPFWNNELMEFFRTSPIEHRIGKKLYDQCLKDFYFSKYNLNFSNELHADVRKIKIQSIKETIKRYLPRKIIDSNLRKNDWSAYYEMSLPMIKELDENIRRKLPYTSFNSVLINWVLKKASEDINTINQES
jgi:asparagine synthase (glutamine-hydrolysing)